MHYVPEGARKTTTKSFLNTSKTDSAVVKNTTADFRLPLAHKERRWGTANM